MFGIREVNKVQLTVLVALVFTLLVAGVFKSPPISFMAAVLFSGVLLSTLVGRLVNRNLGVTRTLPSIGTVGDTISGHVTLHNCSALPVFLVHVRCGEVTTDGKPIIAVGGDEHVTPFLKPRERLLWTQSWRLQRRGLHQLPPAWAGAFDPLALFQTLEPKTSPQEIIVLPRPIRINRLGFIGGAAAGLQTPQHATVVADAMDFHGIRAWVPGEAIRRVHWKSTARTGQLHVIEWEENVASDLTVLLDTNAAGIVEAEGESTFETAVTLTASIAAHLLESGYNFQIFCWQQASQASSELQLLRHEARNASSLGATLQLLAKIQPVRHDGASLPRLAQSAEPAIPRGRSALLIASSLVDVAEAQRALAGLQHGGASVYALVLDAASFRETSPAATASAGDSSSAPMLTPRTRIVRRGDSLAAVLERSL
ncbi:MAG: DUF58 domain-containing protein [Armatimonadota bacterium]|nr:DUF58 domain-containing protein [Armatimonadota bacterium]